MRHLRVPRLLASVLALVASLASPLTAFAHAEAHHRAAHEREHGVTSAAAGVSVVTPLEHADGHAHPQLATAIVGRPDLPVFIAPSGPPAVAATCVIRIARAALLLAAAPPRAGPTHGPPPPSRAPPLG